MNCALAGKRGASSKKQQDQLVAKIKATICLFGIAASGRKKTMKIASVGHRGARVCKQKNKKQQSCKWWEIMNQ